MVSIILPASLLLAALLAVPALFGDFAAWQLGLYLIYGLAAQGIGFLWGKTGILPLGQALFFGLAAYTAAHILGNVDGLGLQILCMLGVIALLALVAFILSGAVFRGRNDSGPYFSLITLALVMIAEQLAGTATDYTGGFNGMSGFDTLAGLDPFGSYYYVIVAVVVVVTAGLLLLNRLPAGLLVQALSDNEPRLQLLGFPTHIIKGLVFALSAAIAGLGGLLFASHQGIVTPTASGFVLSAELVIWTAVGGRFHVFGPLIGAVVIGMASTELRDSFAQWELVIAGLFILVVLKAPGGIAELVAIPLRPLTRRMSARLVPPVPAGDTAPATRFETRVQPLQFKDTYLSAGVVKILNGVHFETPESGVVCVIGPNGAGKTTLLNAITGNMTVTAGHILLGKDRIENRPPHSALQDGIGRKLQIPSVFFSMTVTENLTLAMLAGRARFGDWLRFGPFAWRSASLQRLQGHESLSFLQDKGGEPVSGLSQGYRQFLEFAMTTAAEPRLLLLDEPCAGLSPGETALMTDLVRDYQQETNGLVLVIEHDMSIVERLAVKVLVLDQGRVLAFDDYDTVRLDPAVRAVYSGGSK